MEKVNMENKITDKNKTEAEITDQEIAEREIKPDSSPGRTVLVVILVVFSTFVLYYVIMSLLSPVKEISAINKEFGDKQSGNSVIDERVFSDSLFAKMNREKAWLQSKIIMAETDSISLALNLADSTAKLEINGVSVLKSKIATKKISKVFYKTDEYALSAILASPFIIHTYIGTIEKDPIMIKMAPKDTSEYKPDIIPDTTNLAPVNYMLEMENGIRLYVYQVSGKEEGGQINFLWFDIKDRFRNLRDILKSIIGLKVPKYHPFIKIKLPKDEARFIFRAIPQHGQVAVFL
jgi:hypothetical protein